MLDTGLNSEGLIREPYAKTGYGSRTMGSYLASEKAQNTW